MPDIDEMKTFDTVTQRMGNIYRALERDGHKAEDIAGAMLFGIAKAIRDSGVATKHEVMDMVDEVYSTQEKHDEGSSVDRALPR
ncbi:MAG: hypothetical protein ACRBBW_16195 [Cellvibrionaceae bacterium]